MIAGEHDKYFQEFASSRLAVSAPWHSLVSQKRTMLRR